MFLGWRCRNLLFVFTFDCIFTGADYNFDHPLAFDQAEIVRCLDCLRSGKAVEIPMYDFKTHSRCDETELVQPAEVILLEGILVLHMPSVIKRLNMKVILQPHAFFH